MLASSLETNYTVSIIGNAKQSNSKPAALRELHMHGRPQTLYIFFFFFFWIKDYTNIILLKHKHYIKTKLYV